MSISRFGRAARRPSRSRSQAGLSLVEVLIAAALLLVISISLLPLFMRAMASNVYGSEASTSTTLVRDSFEELNPVPFDHPSLDMVSSRVRLTPRLWDTGERDDGTDVEIGDERWIEPPGNVNVDAWLSNPTNLEGLALWQREIFLRHFTFSDILSTPLISVDAGGAQVLVSLGDKYRFDTPLPAMSEHGHFKELEVENAGSREGHPLGPGQSQTVALYRVY